MFARAIQNLNGVCPLPLQEEMHAAREEKFSAIHKPVAVGSHQLLTVGTTHISKLTDDQLIKEFLSGSYCFHGVSRKARCNEVAAPYLHALLRVLVELFHAFHCVRFSHASYLPFLHREREGLRMSERRR